MEETWKKLIVAIAEALVAILAKPMHAGEQAPYLSKLRAALSESTAPAQPVPAIQMVRPSPTVKG